MSVARRGKYSGEKHPRAILTDRIVRHIRSLAYYHGLYARLARQYDVSASEISDIYRGKAWKLARH